MRNQPIPIILSTRATLNYLFRWALFPLAVIAKSSQNPSYAHVLRLAQRKNSLDPKSNLILLKYLLFTLLGGVCFPLKAQEAHIEETQRTLKTYPYSDPNPIPVLTSNPKIYPYHKFEGYSNDGQMQDWKVIHLENDHIELWVLPEVGGKVWGAREKSTKKEFIYRNEVMKFRNIAMRGPWTSGGIEFNFGIIGHTPATASPVDYTTFKEKDGSVTCVVGATDWPSRTNWSVKISLNPDDAFFTTKALWYNGTGLNQPYYNWMTAAAFAEEDLEFYCPGNQYLKHSGEVRPWPYEYNRNIAEYQANNFTSSKSYHVVGEYNDFFGGYFKTQGYGFGHWSLYDEMPGQKLWLWSLARDGGIWEDLLTDTDGQYIEFQAGRLFNQHFSGGHQNPITQALFPPHTADDWTEKWFPVLKIGGLTDVSQKAVLHIEENQGKLAIGINALTNSAGKLLVKNADQTIHTANLDLKPMEVYQTQIDIDLTKSYTVSISEMDLYYTSKKDSLQLKRPFQQPILSNLPDQWFQKGIEHYNVREYEQAEDYFLKVLVQNKHHLDALSTLAELRYRQGLYDEALDFALKGLQVDTYAPKANFVAGLIFKVQKDWINAKESFGWSARSMAYRSASYCSMAEIELINQKLDLAIHYANRALDFNRMNLNAYKVLTICSRLKGDDSTWNSYLETLLEINPLDHFARFESLFTQGNGRNFPSTIHSELPEQSIFELALDYYYKGQEKEANLLLELLPAHPLALIWLAFINENVSLLKKATELSSDFVFPFRRETLNALAWANQEHSHWKLKYYWALNLWHKQQPEKAKTLMDACQTQPKRKAFYQTRAHLQSTNEFKEKDLVQSYLLDVKDRRSIHALFEHHLDQQKFQKALEISHHGFQIHPSNNNLGFDYAKALIYNDQFKDAIEILKGLEVLPFEGASEGRQLFEWAHYGYALDLITEKKYPQAIQILNQSKEWPENLGVGKPYEPDERFADFLLSHAFSKMGDKDKVQQSNERILKYHQKYPMKNTYHTVFGLIQYSNEDLTNTLIQVYDKGSPGDLSSPVKWAIAYATMNKALLQKMELDYKSKNKKNVTFELITRALQIVK